MNPSMVWFGICPGQQYLSQPQIPSEILPVKIYYSEQMRLLTSPVKRQILLAGHPHTPVLVISGQGWRNTKLDDGHKSYFSQFAKVASHTWASRFDRWAFHMALPTLPRFYYLKPQRRQSCFISLTERGFSLGHQKHRSWGQDPWEVQLEGEQGILSIPLMPLKK